MSRVHLSRQLTLEAIERVADGAGGYAETWQALGLVWAEVTARSGRERDGGDVTLSSTRYRIILRAAPVGQTSRPEPGMRFRDGNRVFTVLAVAEHDAAGRYLRCETTEEVVV